MNGQITWRKTIPNLVTLTAMVAAFYSIILSGQKEFLLAAQLMMVCLILDGLDGNLARWIKGTSNFGAELDTYVDITAYGLAPAMMVYQILVPEFGIWAHALVALTVLSGVLRLSRFRIADPDRGQKGYTGLPITVNGSWVAMLVFVAYSNKGNPAMLTEGWMAACIWICSVLFLVLQVSNVHYAKPSKTPLYFFSGALLVMLLFLRIEIAVSAALAMCAYCFFFGLVTPLIPRKTDARTTAPDSPVEAAR